MKELAEKMKSLCKQTKCSQCPIAIEEKDGMPDGTYVTIYKCPAHTPKDWQFIPDSPNIKF